MPSAFNAIDALRAAGTPVDRFMVDDAESDLVFEAVSGEGAGHLVGSRFPAG